ncbi:heme ABC exporter ATP-binding subunit CcmA/heme exporter protein CcmB [Janthinobacterium sp. CG_23.3]|uniref:heme ABC exporter ATP-binding protein CcmA n=1 Tax=Janthinobacterium sp. CG_23.3 TaxID=3349634 RepID=UPI0038D3A73E
MTVHGAEVATVLELLAVPVFRGGKMLVTEVSFALPGGQYLELQGQNGSGKTSLLRTLAALQSAPPDHPQGERRQAGAHTTFYFSHQSGFRAELRVAEQLALSLEMHDVRPGSGAIKLLKRVGLGHQAQARVGQLSHGQLRRLMLAVMAASGRTVWLIDEPLNALDVQAIALFKELLLEHFGGGGAAVVATHRALDEAIPELAPYSMGTLRIEAQQARLLPPSAGKDQPESARLATPRADRAAVQGWAALHWGLRRELALMAARPQDIVWPSIFHWMVVTLFPFGLGSENALLARAAGGVFWVSALLASLIGAARYFEADFEHGVLNDVKTANVSLPLLVFGKVVAGWLFVGLPLSLASLPLGLLYGLSGDVLLILFASLALGSVSLAAFSCLFAALGLMARQAQIVICLLAFPVFVPLVVFGTAAIAGAQSGIGALAPLMVLASLAMLSVVALPMVTARVLALALE